MKQLFYFCCFFTLSILCSCKSREIGEWKIVNGNQLLLWEANPDSHVTYSWDGKSFDKVINGSGILFKYYDDKLVEKKQLSVQYGAIDSNNIIKLEDGSFYIGNVEDDLFEGFGVYNKGQDLYIGIFSQSKPNGKLNWYKNGKLYYCGEWQNGSFHGKGTLFKEDGSIKKGTWNEGKLIQTYCTVQLSSGLYEGYVLNGKPDGIGVMNYKDSSCYKGDWTLGKWDGNGTYISKTDSIVGGWVKGQLDGSATIKTNDFKYVGECLNNMADGQGNLVMSNSTMYSGEWTDGKMNGYGDITFSNLDYYYGDWVNNNFDGYGSYVFYKSGEYYDGEWKNGLQHGLGTYHSKNYEYNGNWEQGWINGQGRIVYANNDFYEGNFVENVPYGKGYYHFENGNSYNGEFVNGKFNGLGSFYFANGSIYEGEFQNGKIKGDGTLYLIEGKEKIAITANWDGTHNFPKKASILFNNGDLYEGELVNGHPTKNGIWSSINEHTSNSSKISQSINLANEFYKKHKDSWNKIVNNTSNVLIIVEVVAPVAGTIMIATGVGAPIGAGLCVVGKVAAVAAVANVALNVADASIASSSAGVDAYNAINNGKDASGAVKNLGVQVATNAAFVFAPKVLKKLPIRKLIVPLSKTAKTVTRNSSIILSRNKSFGKLVSIIKTPSGYLEKRLVVPTKQSFENHYDPFKKYVTKYLANKIAKSVLLKELNAIIQKGPIRLSKKEYENLLNNPNYIRSYIEVKTGSKKNFMEFFIRLSMGNKKQVKQLLQVSYIRQYVDRSIRRSEGGGVHEWLMTKNFEDFLINPKWRNDGKFLAFALTRFVQTTTSVLFKNGGAHHKMGSGNFHIELSKIIDRCTSKEELFLEIRKYAKKTLTKEAYDEFRRIFADVFKDA